MKPLIPDPYKSARAFCPGYCADCTETQSRMVAPGEIVTAKTCKPCANALRKIYGLPPVEEEVNA